MRSAYLYQSINLLVGIMMVPLLLRYLDVNGFILWSIFITFGGITLQLENAIQTVSVREISKQFHSGNVSSLNIALQKAKLAYRVLSVGVLLPVFIIGLLYLKYVVSEKLGLHGNIEWLVFMLAYSLNYYFGTNNSILLGFVHVAQFNNINSFSRTLNFISTYALLKLGYSVMGLSLSFAFSVVVGVILISRAARKSINNYHEKPEVKNDSNVKFENAKSSNIIKYTFYMLSSFIIYKGGLLVATVIFSNDIVGAYSLTLQAFTMLSMLALVPLQVWLHKLVRAVASGDVKSTFYEIFVSIVLVNLIFISGTVFLIFFGNELLVFIGSKIMLVDTVYLLVIHLAFLVELNILVLVNYLVVKSNYKFVKLYVSLSLIGIFLAVILTLITKSSVITLVIVPLGIQSLLCLPFIFRLTYRELGIDSSEFKNLLGGLIWKR
ncbi:MAG: hypothetical protein IMY67_04085 [Bacteroidetes bacterium]|nr:hypothetical protein [Bacteroidota bacterium]